jgi:hypothetical protein
VKRSLLVALLGLLSIVAAEAETVLRVYVMPMVGVGTRADKRRPKYADTTLGHETEFDVTYSNGVFTGATYQNDDVVRIGNRLVSVPQLWDLVYVVNASGSTFSVAATPGGTPLLLSAELNNAANTAHRYTPYSFHTFGIRQVSLVAAIITTTRHNELAAFSDVLPFPAGFQSGIQTVGNQANTLTTAIESFGIPAQWVTNQMTYLAVLHTVGAMFQYMGRVYYMLNSDPFAGATLNTRIGDLTVEAQNALFAAGQSFGWNLSGVNANTTVRNFVKYMADQWGATPIPFEWVTI